MFEVLHYQNEQIDKKFETDISRALDEVRTFLPILPEIIKVYFSNYGIIPELGVGGYAYANDIMTISIDPKFGDRTEQRASLRAMVFHESFHLYQRFTGEEAPFSAIENAVYEGMATIFERDCAGVLEPYGDYGGVKEDKLAGWIEELKKISTEEFTDETLSLSWKFYHPELKERWIVYRSGAWLVDKVLSAKKLTILDLKDKTANEVFEMYEEILEG